MRMIDRGKPIFKLQYKDNWFFRRIKEQKQHTNEKKNRKHFFLTFRKITFYEKRSSCGHMLAKYLLKYPEKLKSFKDQRKKYSKRNKNQTGPGFSAIKSSRKHWNIIYTVEKRD